MDRSREQYVASSSQKDDATTKLRQGSILPRSMRDRLGLSDFKDNPDPILVVISHSCDLVQPYETEPHVELIYGQRKDEMKNGLSNGQSPRTLHLEYEQNGTKKVLELCAFNKVPPVDKRILIGIEPDANTVLTPKSLEILQRWLAVRYNRAAFPDDLDSRMKPIKKKLHSVDSDSIVGIWMQYEPKDNHLPNDVPYELKIKIVYSTLVYNAKAKAEKEANSLSMSFEKNFFNKDKSLWSSIDLRTCEAVPDTVFSVRDLLSGYNQWRLEHLSLKQDPPGEYI